MATGAIAFDGNDLTGLFSSVGAAKTFYFVDAAASGSSHGSLQDGGTAPTVASTTTGWIVGTTAATHYSNLAYATQQLASTFGTTALPNGAPGTNNCFRSQNAYTGNFIAGNWAFKLSAIATAALSGTCHARIRVWISSSATGASATEITTATLTMGNWANLTTSTAQDATLTWAAPSFAMVNQYLFIEIALETTVASGASTAAMVLRVGNVTPSISSIVTTAFTTGAPPSQFLTACAVFQFKNTTSVAGTIFAFIDTLSTVAFVNSMDLLLVPDGSTLHGTLWLESVAGDIQLSAMSALNINTWYFVAITCDGSGNFASYWAPLGATTLTVGLNPQALPVFVPVQVTVGSDGTSGSGKDYLLGDVSDFKIWSNVVLTQAELTAESLQVAPVQTEGLWDWWAFPNDTTGLTSDTANKRVLTGNASHISNVDGPPLPTNFGSGICPF